MSLLPSACCQSCTGADCFWGATSEDRSCRLNKRDRLWLKVERPGHTHTERQYWTGSACPCDGERYDLVKTCDERSDLVAAYRHYNNTSSAGSADYPWFYVGPGDLGGLWPACQNACCGYEGSPDDADCCDDGIGCTTYRTPVGYCSERQKEAIRTGLVASTDATNVESCDYGLAYAWLREIADNTYGSVFQNYDENGAADGTTHLAGALLMVAHREIHWRRPDPDDGCTESVLPLPANETIDWACRIPEVIGFACSGCPVFAFELASSTLSPSLDDISVNRADLIKSIHDGEPLTQEVTDALIEDGVLNLDVHSGHDEPIYKRIIGTGSRPLDTYIRMYARPGGWFWICKDFHGTDSETVLDNYWPQVARGYSEDCDTGGENKCWTAAPTPQDCTCTANASQWCPNSGDSGNPCDSSTWGDCDIPLAPLCDESTCVQDVYSASATGIAWKHIEYAPADDTTSDCTTCPVVCVLNNNAYWWVQPANESGGGDDECTAEVCPHDFDHETVPDVRHYMPELISQNIRNDTQDIDDACCGADGLYSIGSLVFCPAVTPNADDCDQYDPERPMSFETQSPGTGCGRHPCEDQPLGRCYDPLGSEAIHDVTEAECDKCGWTWAGEDTC